MRKETADVAMARAGTLRLGMDGEARKTLFFGFWEKEARLLTCGR